MGRQRQTQRRQPDFVKTNQSPVNWTAWIKMAIALAVVGYFAAQISSRVANDENLRLEEDEVGRALPSQVV